MTRIVENIVKDGNLLGTREVLRNDAVAHRGYWHVPTTESTQWVHNWGEFKAAGGQVGFNEDQTEIKLRLPEPYKFSIQFPKETK